MALKTISIRGAREHNLKCVDIDIPRDKLVVVTGMSGSGKSTLVFDTIYAEGQRKYIESLSAYARQFLDQLQKPDIESIEGLPPTIAIEQRSASHNPRSTVATTTEIYDYLRLLFARAGQPRCWHRDKEGEKEQGEVCGKPITGQSATQIVDQAWALPEGSRIMVLAPLIRGKKGHHKEIFESMIRQGFVRARVNGDVIDLREPPESPLLPEPPTKKSKKKTSAPRTSKGKASGGGGRGEWLDRYKTHTIEIVIDRIVIRRDDEVEVRSRLADSIELALKLANGLVVIAVAEDGQPDAWTDKVFSENYACAVHPDCSLEDMEPRLFSFNSPYGACRACGGLGTVMEFDPDLIVPDSTVSLSEGALDAWRHGGKRMNIYYNRLIRKFCKKTEIDSHSPFKTLTKSIRRVLLHGTTPRDEEKLEFSFEGVIPNLQRRWENTDSEYVRAKLHHYLSVASCETCHGARLRTEAMNVFIEDTKGQAVNIAGVTGMTIEQAVEFFETLKLNRERRQIAKPILKEVVARLGFMRSVGLGYLSLDRGTGTLSGGEGQRIRLATQVGSGLVGCCYVLDEPTIGLHQRDNDRLIKTLRHLTDIGNSVLVVEHDEDTIRSADWLIDIGPGPGRHGGKVVAEGTVDEVLQVPESITAKYLSGELKINIPWAELPGEGGEERGERGRRVLDHKKPLVIKGAKQNNLKSIDVSFPLGGIVCVTGVSGSGKSTLVNQILLRAVKRRLYSSREKPGDHKGITGLGGVDRVIEVDQSPIGRTPRSNPATYTGAFDAIRTLYTKTKEAKIRGYKPGRFSFNVKGGRCESCQGQGTKKIEMHFLPDVYVQCEECKGKRYNRETLEVRYKGKSIADVLDMTIEEAAGFFENFPVVKRLLDALNDVGLSYVQLGQSSITLSGGEAQRVKLATELGKRSTGHTLYVLDEPTTGLHFADIDKLLSVLARLADAGNTIIVIEHNMDVIKCADWIIDLGPDGGDRGGSVVATGTPEQVAELPESYTGQYLQHHLESQAVAAG